MPRRRKDETDKGLWSIETGERPFTVRVREDKARGSNVVLDYRGPDGKRRVQTVRPPFSIRDERGRMDDEMAALAENAGKRKSAELRLGVLEQETEPERLTVGAAFARYMDPARGGMPRSPARRRAYTRARDSLFAHLEHGGGAGAHTPWNRLSPADVWAWLVVYRDRGMYSTAIAHAKCLNALSNWLRKKARLKGLEHPTEGLEWKALSLGHTPRRERYTPAELERLDAVRREVDPRFALMFALMYDSVVRIGEVGALHRSQIDARVDRPPPLEMAPHGWVLYPGVKGQRARLDFLTEYQREAFAEAFAGYLREMEARWQEHGTDYLLFPGHKLKRGRIPPERPSVVRPVAHTRRREWLAQAEERASPSVPHREWKAWHAVRRASSDHVFGATDLATLTAAGGWESQATPESIYLDERRYEQMARATEAQARKRGPKTP